ncbi:bifunctional acetate--CoA ligase family protein/GNAT family N-acetyltransferase [Stieleria sp. ICT_E10.1]|uniref:bifunctional acetate--CoA ligase family protein/GNAT family N-acetyltransferase n=1 Tax=Stieleria sedimenti TaxID=2976331 RepID=UPI00217F468D|nr:bifunctional acetate--CoA ligase family protein/GNAT family N-acetyltransferase [Stieleria sedimenti]MCS7468052.1 bifunctional acetate--CoA ligase family protein/GNAT family N-acetyltransferase [Stieleria sedimenti]
MVRKMQADATLKTCEQFTMPIRNLDMIFAPRSVVVIGASERRSSAGRIVLDNLVSGGFAGPVYRVNPRYTRVGGMPCYAAIADLPEAVDLAVICSPAETVPRYVAECGEAGIRGLVILTSGFREAAPDGKVLQAAVLQSAEPFEGLRIVGPNSLGVMAPHLSFNASFVSDLPPTGNIAFISQSAALCTAVLDWAIQENVGFSHFVSVGNMLDVGIADLIDYFAIDRWTRSIILYVGSITEPRKFMSAARAFTRTKPIIAYKAGRFSGSAKAAATHTGTMAGVDSVYEAAMKRAGVFRVYSVEQLFDCAKLLSQQKTPSGPRLAIITNAGGPGVIATDELLDQQGSLAKLSDDTIEKLSQQLPRAWSHGNPVDVLRDATPERFQSSVELVLADRGVDGVLVVLSPYTTTDPTGIAAAVVQAAKHASKPILAAWMGGGKVREGTERLNAAGIPTYSSPEKGVRAFMNLVSYGRNRETLYETPREIPIEFPLYRAKQRSLVTTFLSEGHDVLTESTSKAFLQAHDIPVIPTHVACSLAYATECAARVGYPVALKVFSPDITHKTHVGGVELNLANRNDVALAYDRILKRAKEFCPDARIDGVTVQRMLVEPNSRELIVGAKRDPVFGTVLMVGAGGTTTELLRDLAFELPPLNERLARRMVQSLKAWPLLQGEPGRPGINLNRLVEVLMRLSYLVADYPEITELDVNPLWVTSHDVIALDARIVVDHDAVLHPVRPYSHLAIRPYPDEYTKRVILKDSTAILLRPIKPEDEPMWHRLLASCSPESLHMRFRYMFKASSHEMATRFCYIDYDREIAIVAEDEDDGHRKLLGVCRLVADADHHEAEFAILVGDPWQGIGLGSVLMDYCLGICADWGIRSVVAEMAPRNSRMITMFSNRGFVMDRSQSDDVVIARKRLSPLILA